jgi:hypothetical protein
MVRVSDLFQNTTNNLISKITFIQNYKLYNDTSLHKIRQELNNIIHISSMLLTINMQIAIMYHQNQVTYN